MGCVLPLAHALLRSGLAYALRNKGATLVGSCFVTLRLDTCCRPAGRAARWAGGGEPAGAGGAREGAGSQSEAEQSEHCRGAAQLSCPVPCVPEAPALLAAHLQRGLAAGKLVALTLGACDLQNICMLHCPSFSASVVWQGCAVSTCWWVLLLV